MADVSEADVTLTPYFESTGPEESVASHGADYAAGLRNAGSGECYVHILLPAGSVERVLLARARIELMLDPDGRIYVEPMGLVDDVVDAGKERGQLPMATLRDLVKQALALDSLRHEDEPLAALTSLRVQLNDALAIVDDVFAKVKSWPPRSR